MAAEALDALGRTEEIIAWVQNYKRCLEGLPTCDRPILRHSWKEALGDSARMGDWIAFFGRELRENPWRSVLQEWADRLAPGFIASATHGIIRTAHAARSLGKKETSQRLNELAQGLAYWSATYRTLPEITGHISCGLKPSEALRQIEAVPAERRQPLGLIMDALEPLQNFASFATVINYVGHPTDAATFISDLTEAFARVYLKNAEPTGRLITFIHTVTGTSAVRLLLPLSHFNRSQANRSSKWKI